MRTRKVSRLVRLQPTLVDQPDRMRRVLEQLVQALVGLAERQLPGDPLPCFCVRHDQVDTSNDESEASSAGEPHDEWCEDARLALKAVEELKANARLA